MASGPAGCFLFTLLTLYFSSYSQFYSIVFFTSSYFITIMCQKLESAVFYKETEAGPQLRKVLMCIICAL